MNLGNWSLGFGGGGVEGVSGDAVGRGWGGRVLTRGRFGEKIGSWRCRGFCIDFWTWKRILKLGEDFLLGILWRGLG